MDLSEDPSDHGSKVNDVYILNFILAYHHKWNQPVELLAINETAG